MTSTQAALDYKLLFAAYKCLLNYGFFIGATAENLKDLRSAAKYSNLLEDWLFSPNKPSIAIA
ncbi:MAG: hypothetical protein QNJ18_06270 [Xenococcaceae cyanobacterium MO_167.B52]|nr:hypothetical protein [Xenococcaceae cyanobacterium MO_167.B52]